MRNPQNYSWICAYFNALVEILHKFNMIAMGDRPAPLSSGCSSTPDPNELFPALSASGISLHAAAS